MSATANALSASTNFPHILATEVFSKVKGHSTLAMLSGQEAVPFSGKDIFTFSMANEVSIVGENGAKPEGAAAVSPVSMVPLKIVYQERVSDEFMKCSQERQIEILKAFSDGFSKKIAKGIDIMAFHGIDPQSKQSSDLIGANNFDSKITGGNIIVYSSSTPDANIDAAIAAVEGAEYEVTGIAMAPAMRTAIANMRTGDAGRAYPEFAWGATPGQLGGKKLDVNPTVSYNSSGLRAIVGDFETAFRWGIAETINFETIQYGDPDGQGTDLKNRNQVCLRAECYVGWAILDPAAFASVETGE